MKTMWKLLVAGVIIILLLVIAVPIAIILRGEWTFGETIEVIPIKGEITLADCSPGLIAAGQCSQVSVVKSMLADADKSVMVKAIVLDINSGGGSVVASREMMRAVRNTQKPVIAWIGEVGASGAYYVASATDHIVADRNSITGSLGVRTSIMHYYGLMDKIGVNVTVIKSVESKDLGSPYRPMTDEERADFQRIVDIIHADFVEDIAKNRGLPLEYVDNISHGDIYLGSEAKDLRLVDSLGGMDAAIDMAKSMGGIKGEPIIKEVKGERSWRQLLDRLSVNIGYGLGRSFLKWEV